MMTFQESVDYLISFYDLEKATAPFTYSFNLVHFENFLQQLGSPHKSLKKTILVAGTKGKGSTAAMIAAGLRAQGYRVGLFNSPHLSCIRERIAVDGHPISEREFAQLVEDLKPRLSLEKRNDFRTVFEILTTMAFLHFLRSKVDFAVLEVGLGGRLDSTNIVNPAVSVITSISLDHTHLLGKTLPEIAREKAGIIKKGGWVVSAPQVREVEEVIKERCKEVGAKLIQVGRDVTYYPIRETLNGSEFVFHNLRGKEEIYYIPLLGEYQMENAALAISTLKILQSSRKRISLDKVKMGLKKVKWPGRMEIVSRNPWIVLDGAHNVDSAFKLKKSIQHLFPYRNLILVLGISMDKDAKGIMEVLLPIAKAVIFTKALHPRASPPELLAQQIQGKRETPPFQIESNSKAAYKQAKKLAQKEDLILITGSLFLVGEIRENLIE